MKRLWNKGVAWSGLALGCLMAVGCGASVNPTLKRQVDQRVAGLSNSSEVHEAPTATEAPELEVGTWAVYKMVDDEGNPSFLTYKVLRQEEGKYWIETVSESYYSRTVQLMRAGFGARQSPEDIVVDRLYQKVDDDAVQEFPQGMLGLMSSLYEPMLARLSISWTDLPQEDVRVVAGHFKQAYKKRVTSELAGFSDTSDVWYHDAAPVGGTVRSTSLEHGTSMELVDMGTDPKSEIPIP